MLNQMGGTGKAQGKRDARQSVRHKILGRSVLAVPVILFHT